MSENVIQKLENATKPIVDEICQNGQEPAFRIWDDPTHPLSQAIRILMTAKASVFAGTPEAATLKEVLKQEPPASLFGRRPGA